MSVFWSRHVDVQGLAGCGLGWDGMGWDGARGKVMGWDEMRSGLFCFAASWNLGTLVYLDFDRGRELMM